MGKSASIDRQVIAYPDPKYHRLLVASSKVYGTSISAQIGKALKAYYDGLTPREIEELISRSKNV